MKYATSCFLMFLTFLLKCLFLFAKQSNLELNQISLSNSKYELVQLWRAKYSYKYRLATVFRISIFRIIPVRSESRSNNEQTLFEFSTSIFLFLGIGGIVPPPPDMSTLSEPNTGNVTAPVSIKRTRVFEIRSIKVRVPHGLCARQPYTSGIDVRAYWIRWNDGRRVLYGTLVRKLGINGITQGNVAVTILPSIHCGNQIGLSVDTPNRNEETRLCLLSYARYFILRDIWQKKKVFSFFDLAYALIIFDFLKKKVSLSKIEQDRVF